MAASPDSSMRHESRASAPLLSGAGACPSTASWAAIVAGAAGAAALSLILLILGVGLGFSSVSPWAGQGASATAFGWSTILWLTFTQIAASGMGGYLAGRLRTVWVGAQVDEVYFRDTAHGFLAWAVATLVTAGLLTSSIGAVLGAGAQAGSAAIGAAATTGVAAAGAGAAAASRGGGDGYFIDSLFRKAPEAPSATAVADGSANASTAAPTGEVARIFAQSAKAGSLSPDDSRYLGQLVAQRTGLSADDATKRVNDVFARSQAAVADAEAKAKEAADKARKASAYVALWLFVSLLAGAFTASFAATFGGRRRDHSHY